MTNEQKQEMVTRTQKARTAFENAEYEYTLAKLAAHQAMDANCSEDGCHCLLCNFFKN